MSGSRKNRATKKNTEIHELRKEIVALKKELMELKEKLNKFESNS
jgi:uncharacterized protein YdcH (DUF465 family)